MAFYLEKAIFVNRAPFEHLELDFKENEISVLTAVNGKGKTTILSYIVDAFYELARKHYSNDFEGKETKYYRISSSIYNIDANCPSFVYLRFQNNRQSLDYVDIRGKCQQADYEQSITIDNKIPFEKFRNSLQGSNNIKFWNIDSKEIGKVVSSVFDNNLVTYFPSYRYEIPAYLNEEYQYKSVYKMEGAYSRSLKNPIEVVSGIKQLANWVLDVVLDWETYKQTQNITLPDGGIQSVDNSPELNIWKNLNAVLRQTLSSKHYVGTVRMGIGKRNNAGTRISIVAVNNGNIITISPSLFCLSAGESAMLCCFGELLRQADEIQPNILMKDISGIVLIDEVDKHLHITLQKEVLPKMFKMFPNVQFIVSSHSPFLNMGLADDILERTQIIDLDNGGIQCDPTNNDLYKEVYEMMINENQRFANKCKELEQKVHSLNKPVIITEGKTDWKHLKAALHYFKQNHEFEDLDIEILEYNFDFGDSKLHNLLNQNKNFPNKYLIIGIFDCDEDNGKKIRNEGGVRKYNDKIWGISIDIPDFRNYNTSGISIEFLYRDEDLKRIDEHGRRIYVTSEFNECGRLISNHSVGVKNFHDVKNYILREKERIQADEVIDTEGNSLALSKDQFATNIMDGIGDFANVSFEAFKTIFERVKSIIQQV
jgi:predicted ATP-binding protein involved in virulence